MKEPFPSSLSLETKTPVQHTTAAMALAIFHLYHYRLQGKARGKKKLQNHSPRRLKKRRQYFPLFPGLGGSWLMKINLRLNFQVPWWTPFFGPTKKSEKGAPTMDYIIIFLSVAAAPFSSSQERKAGVRRKCVLHFDGPGLLHRTLGFKTIAKGREYCLIKSVCGA